jgi:hypothetical protein
MLCEQAGNMESQRGERGTWERSAGNLGDRVKDWTIRSRTKGNGVSMTSNIRIEFEKGQYLNVHISASSFNNI